MRARTMQVIARLRSLPTYAAQREASEWLVLAPFGVFCFVFPWAILLLSLDLMPFGMEWMSSLLLAMLGLACGGWLWLNFGSRGAVVALGIFVLGVALEYVGLVTGVPFGRYTYTGVLVPDLPGGVPMAIGFAWLFVIVAGFFSARQLISSSFPAWTVPAGALLAVGMDLLLEPVAFHIKGYWRWLDTGGGYYGVPWSNFAAWFLAALAMNFLLLAFLRPARPRLGWLPVTLLAMNVVLFGIVNAAHGIWVPPLLSLGMLGVLYRAWRVERGSAATSPS